MKRARTELPKRVCVGCGAGDDRGALLRDDDNLLRCRSCAEKRRVELCPVKTTDLRTISRRAARCLTVVTLHMDWETEVRWLVFGEAQFRHHERRGTDTLMAYLTAGVTDVEEDSAYALALPLIGLRFERLDYHSAHFAAWVEPDAEDDFRVPRPGYNPMQHPDAYTCKDCEEPHVIVPAGYYQPPRDPALYKHVQGKRVEICVTQPSEED